MSSQGRRLDHWRTSLDAVDALRLRMAEVEGPQDDPITRRLMAQVAHAKSSSFIALLDPEGNVLDVNPAALIAGGVDRSEVIGLPLWATAWWAPLEGEVTHTLQQALTAAAGGRFTRFDVDVRLDGSAEGAGTMDLILRPLRGRDGQVAFLVAEG